MTQISAPPVPAGVYRAIYPASVVLPGDVVTVWHQAKVYLTPDGVYVFRRVADEPDYYAPANYGASGQAAGYPRNGYRLFLDDGTVLTITAGGGCGCGSPLKSWNPAWAANVLPWPSE